MNDKAQGNRNAENLLLALAGDIQLRQSRVLRSGPWCYFCGAAESLVTCGCGLPESLGCINQRLCSDCCSAHRTIAGHLKRMFFARIVDRVSSIRGKLFDQLIGAAEALAEANGTDPESESGLKLLLCQACPYDDSRSEFRNTILTAFHRSRFSDFGGLAKELERERDSELAMKLARWFSCAR